MKNAVASKDEALATQESRVRALEDELDATRDALDHATRELENVWFPAQHPASAVASILVVQELGFFGLPCSFTLKPMSCTLLSDRWTAQWQDHLLI